MKNRILSHTSILVVLSVLLTFLAAGIVMYDKFDANINQGIRDEAQYIRTGIEQEGNGFLTDKVGSATSSRITLTDEKGTVLFDSAAEPETLPNHSDRPEFIEAAKKGEGENVRFSETLSSQTFYYAVRLESGEILRVAKTTESFFKMLFSSFTLLGILVVLILFAEFFLVQRQTDKLIEPINKLDLEHPLQNVCYEELRPLLVRVDEQNKQIAQQVDELKSADAVRKEFTANVSHELKTPLMSISGYAELMMNGMVPPDKVQEFSGRIYHESERLSNLVADIIQLSRLDEKSGDMMFEIVDICELGEDVVKNLQERALIKDILFLFTGENAEVYGVRHVLYEMFYNITDNAIRYTQESGTVKVFVGKKEEIPFYCVEDNGIGIPKAEQSRIFERFYRVDKSHSRETGGTGLGLSILKHGAVLHHAKIILESEPGKGTKMELLFK